ncbi:MAG: queuosine precursor transporter [Bacilli bacterium]|nr:queuosine precursor transporter [Bacilli bacterium]
MKNYSIFKRITLLFKAVPKTVVILFCLTIVGMNILAQYQLVSLPFLAINAGICISWLSFLILDVVTKHFGAKAANYLSILAVTINLIVGLAFFSVSVALNNPKYDVFAFSSWSILLASTVAFIISALTNNYVNVFVGKRIKRNPDGRIAFTLRSHISTFLGQIVDNFLFVFLAFYVLPYIPFAIQVRWTIWQCLGASVLGAIIELFSEIIFTPIGYRVSKYWKDNRVGEEYIKTTYELEKMSAFEIGELVNNRILTPLEVVQYFERRINKYNKKINAFTYTKFDEAESKALELEKRINNGEYVGPFAGVPFGLKDFLDSKKGWSNSCGGIPSLDRIDSSDSLFCEAMEKLGGIAIGKCNAPTYGFRGTCDNLRYGATKNPYNLKYNSGGSSGGSAAAVSAGLLPIAEGGDAGGSIRVPASWTGIFGYKASTGTVPIHYASSVDPNYFPFCQNGGLTKSVKDTAILLNEMQRFDSSDPFSEEKENVDYLSFLDKPIKGMKIAYTDDFGIFPVENQIKKKVYKKAKSLEKYGAIVDRVNFDIRYTNNELSELWGIAISQESASECLEYKNKGLDLEKGLPKELLYWNERAIKEKDKLVKYGEAKEAIKNAFDEVFKDYDLIISPVSCCMPVKNDKNNNTKGPEMINGQKIDPLIGFAMTFIVNFVGNPACSVPIGLGKHHLPIGLQIIGKYMEDETVLQLASNFEKVYPFKK